LRFAFFHGDPFTVLIIPALVALVVVVFVIVATAILVYDPLKQNKVPALYFALPYFIPVALILVLLAISSKGSGLHSISFVSSFFLTLPWSALGHWALDSLADPRSPVSDSAAVIVAAAGVNTLILYCLGIVARVVRKRRNQLKGQL
jgi:ABC-type sugar transport system permease subunit